MRWDRLSILLDRLAHEQDELSMFLLTRDGTLVSQQDGVFRTNCIDCLDRTNVVQSMLAKRSLTNALQVRYCSKKSDVNMPVVLSLKYWYLINIFMFRNWEFYLLVAGWKMSMA